MSRQFMYGTVMAAALTVGLGAQTPSPQSYPQDKPQSRPEPKESSRGQTLTLVGCMQSGDQTGPTGTAGTTTPSAKSTSGMQFVLKDATEGSAGKAGAGAAGTAGTTGMASVPSTLNLTASGSTSSSGWSKYLNHKVEVKGTLEHSMGGAESTPTGNPPSATTPANPPSGAGDMNQTFRVTSIHEVAESCSGTPK